MRRSVLAVFLLGFAVLASAQVQEPDRSKRLPDGRSRDLAILKQDHEKTLEDIAELRKLAEELETELQEQSAHVTNLESLRKAERIEELAQRLQKRMKRIP